MIASVRLLRPCTVLLCIGPLVSTAPLAGQVRVGVRTGMVLSTDLVTDSVVEPIAVRPNTALVIGAVVDTRVEGRYRLGASLQVSRSNLTSHTAREATEITTLTVWHPSATLRQEFGDFVAVEFALGAMIYDPERRLGTIFQDGAPIEPAAGIAVSATRPFGSRFTVDLGIAYDIHRFSTSRLRSEGFDGKWTVHRASVRVTVRGDLGAS